MMENDVIFTSLCCGIFLIKTYIYLIFILLFWCFEKALYTLMDLWWWWSLVTRLTWPVSGRVILSWLVWSRSIILFITSADDTTLGSYYKWIFWSITIFIVVSIKLFIDGNYFDECFNWWKYFVRLGCTYQVLCLLDASRIAARSKR